MTLGETDIYAISVPSQYKAKISGAPFFCLYPLKSSFKIIFVQYLLQELRLCTVLFFPYRADLPPHFRIPFMFRTISLRTVSVFRVFCLHQPLLLSRLYLGLLLIWSFTSQLLWHLLTSACSVLPYDYSYSFQSMPCRPPRVLIRSYSPSIFHIYHTWFCVVIGLQLVAQSYPHA